MLKKIKSKNILENIIQYFKEPKLKLKLFFYSKYFQNIFDLNLYHFQKNYLQSFQKNLNENMIKEMKKNDSYLQIYIKKGYTIVNINDKEEKIFKCFLYLKRMKDMKINPPLNDFIILDDSIKFILQYLEPISFIKFDINRSIENNKENNNNNSVVELNTDEENNMLIQNEARIINLIDEKQNIIYIHFIHNVDYLEKVLVLRNFESYYMRPEEYKKQINNSESAKNLNDLEESSSDSIVSLDDLTAIFSAESILSIYKYNVAPILCEKNFNQKYSKSQNLLKDLSNNAKFYFKDINKKFIWFKEYINMVKEIYDFAHKKSSVVMYLFGPKGSSKSTFLLYSKYLLLGCRIKYLYLDINCLKSKSIIDRKRIISHELLYFFKDINEMKEVEKNKIFHDINYLKGKFLFYIYNLLKNLFEVKLEKNDRKIIIIDNIYDEKCNSKEGIKAIIHLIEKYKSDVKLILCGNGQFFNKKFIELYEKNSFQTNGDYENAYFLSIDKKIISNNINQSKEFLKYSLKFNYLYENQDTMEELKKKIIEEEQEYLERYTFYGLFFSDELNKKKIPKEEIIKDKKIYYEMPLDYFEIIINNDNSVEFLFFHSVYKSCIKKKIGYEVKKRTLTRLLKYEDYPRTFFGICFEKKLTLLLRNNQLNLPNLFFEEENIKEINQINILEEKNYKGTIFQIKNKNKPILLVQEDFFGPNYDLLILSRQNNKFYANFVQIGVDKDKKMIEQILEDLHKHEQNYKINIVKAFGLESNDINLTLLFIFDLETQKASEYSSGAKFCFQNKINYFLFSNNFDYLLRYDNNLKELNKCDYFIPQNLVRNDKKKIQKKIEDFFHF